MGTRQGTPRRLIVLASVAALVMVVVVAIRGAGGPSDPAPSDGSSGRTTMGTTPASSTGPSTDRAGMSVGYSQDEEGAISAAVAYATASQRWLYFTDAEVEAAVRAIASPTSADDLVDSVVTEISEARDKLGESPGPVWWLVRPLAWSVIDHTREHATVEVWAVTVLSATEVAAPQAEWRNFTVDLIWQARDWKLTAIRNLPGPTPMVGPGDRPWDAIPFDEGLDGFTRMDGEPVR